MARYYIIAGEPSGDLHARELIDGLKTADAKAEIRFWDSSLMVPVMGLVEVIRHIGRIAGIYGRCCRDLVAFNPDVVILVDYPGFNLKMARFAHKRGLKVFYYIAPKLWARAENRISKIKKYVDELFIIFPFEIEYFKKLGVNPHYNGNSLVDHIASAGIEPVCGGGKTIAFLAGSRRGELAWLMPRFVKIEEMMRRDTLHDWSAYKLLVAGAPNLSQSDYDRYIPEGSRFKVVFGATYSILSQADSAVISSGTASLEAAIIGTPQVVGYGFNPITYAIGIHFYHSKFFSLANLICDKLIFKELLQKESSPEALFDELTRITFDGQYRAEMKENYARVRQLLGEKGAALRTAREMVSLLGA